MESKKINNNEHPYVDLGLPSGTLWSTCNVGADKPSDYGLYFQWGDTQGYTKEQIGYYKNFTWKSYKFRINEKPSNVKENKQVDLSNSKSIITKGSSKFNKYKNKGDTLELEDDAANKNMGGDWHIPTNDQIIELFNNTTTTWIEEDGIEGMTFTSKKDDSKSIFIPAAGVADNDSVCNIGKIGYLWSSMRSDKYDTHGMILGFFVSCVFISYYYRYLGMPVRGVIG